MLFFIIKNTTKNYNIGECRIAKRTVSKDCLKHSNFHDKSAHI